VAAEEKEVRHGHLTESSPRNRPTESRYGPRARPYRDLPNIAPHQIAGKIDARQFDVLGVSDEELRAAFVDAVQYPDEKALLDRSNVALPSGMKHRTAAF
jgi:hypothetical protein